MTGSSTSSARNERVMTMKAIQILLTSLLVAVPLPQAAAGDDETFLAAPLPGATNSLSTMTNWWLLKCKVDAMEDYRSCYISFRFHAFEFGHFSARINQGGKVYLWAIGGDIYPGSQQIIRVDANKPHRSPGGKSFVGTSALLKEIRSGIVLRTRWYDWPKNTKQDMEHPLKGFGEALDLALAIVDRKEFSLPLDALEKMYSWEGHTLRRSREHVREAMRSVLKCNLAFDPDQRVEEILASIPGVAGRAMRKAYAEPHTSASSTECRKHVAVLSAGITLIPNLKYPQ